MSRQEDEQELQRELCVVVRTFVDGVLKGLERMREEEVVDVDPEAEMVAALMDSAIALCLRRGASLDDIVRAVREHAAHLQHAKRTAN